MVPTRENVDRFVSEIERFLAGAPQHQGSVEPDHRVLATLLFTDIVGSTSRAAELGDRAWRDLLQRHHELVRRELVRFRGQELDRAGDGFFDRFDGPARAIQCAVNVEHDMRELGIDIRAGLHTGECELLSRRSAVSP